MSAINGGSLSVDDPEGEPWPPVEGEMVDADWINLWGFCSAM